jgi:hypothetical protein
LEALESRALLSVTIAAGGKSASFTDVDGDLVTVAVSKGTLTAGLFITAASGLGEQLQRLDLSAAAFAGANVTISVRPAAVNPTGDGLTDVGFIDGAGHAMGKIVVAGDLGRVNGGAIMSLAAFSMGRQGLASQGGAGNLTSAVGDLKALTVTTDVDEAFINSSGNIGSVKVGGSLIGGTTFGSGSITAAKSIGTVTIGQSLIARTDVGAAGATQSASVWAENGSIGAVTIGGSVLGGAAIDSGVVLAAGKMGKVVIGGELKGGAGDGSGKVDADVATTFTIVGSITGGAGDTSGILIVNKIGNVTVGGSVVGGPGSDSGAIWSQGDMGTVAISGNVVGGDSSSADAFYTGYVQADGKMGNVTIGGSVIAGTNNGSGTLLSGSIRAGTTMGSVLIKGNLVGNATLDAIISARGVSSANGSVAIAGVTVLGTVDHARIYTGYDVDQVPVYGGAGVGKIVVGQDWIASSVLAGVTVGGDGSAGTNDDEMIAGVGAGKSKIAGVVIGGKVFGTAGAGDNFGFVASSIGSFSAAGVGARLTAGKDTLTVGGTTDVVLREIGDI